MKESRTKSQIKLDAIQRYATWQGWLPHKHIVPVSEFPKSGGTWFCQMLSHAIDVPFPRNTRLLRGRCIMHSHLIPRDHHRVPITVIRDGRDVMVSAYHHFVLGHNHSPSFLTKSWRSKMPFKEYDKASDNMSAFIEVFFSEYRVGGKNMTWRDHANVSLKHPSVGVVKYEELLTDPLHCLLVAVEHIGDSLDNQRAEEAIEMFAFKKQTKREAGQENRESFLRKGISGDWKNYFDLRACETFDKLAGDMLIKLNYEKDHNWY